LLGLNFCHAFKNVSEKIYLEMMIDQVFFKGYSYRIEKLINIGYSLSRSNVEFGLDCVENIREEFEKSKYLLKSSQSKMIKHCLYRIKQRIKSPKTKYDRADIWIFTSQLNSLVKEAFLENDNIRIKDQK
jgi:hypothetical protein